MKKSIIVSHVAVTVLLIVVLVSTLFAIADSRQTLFSAAHIAYVQKVNEELSTQEPSARTIMLLAREANLIRLCAIDGLGDGNLAKETILMLDAVEYYLEEIQGLLEDNLAVDTQIADLITFTNQAEELGRDELEKNRSFKFMWLIK